MNRQRLRRVIENDAAQANGPALMMLLLEVLLDIRDQLRRRK